MYDEEFCYPSDFYWINTDHVKEWWTKGKIKTIVVLLCYFGLASLCMVGYYILYPLKYIHKKCENWCYR